ncbi:hypothetical protein [Dongia sp. agr-C8]
MTDHEAKRAELRTLLAETEAKLAAARDAACNGGSWSDIPTLERGAAALHVQLKTLGDPL